MESEVRFSVNKKSRKKVEHWLSHHESKIQNSETVYFDTKKNALRKAGVELRVRRNEGGIKQTIKSVGPHGSLFTRSESEIQISDFEPKLKHLNDFLSKKKLEKIDLSRLQTAFRTKVKRTIINKPSANGLVESVFDIGQIETDTQKLELSEVEHELKKGNPDALVETCHNFLDQVPCSIGLEGKAARGYRLLSGEYPEPVYASKMSISPTTPTPGAIRLIFQSSFQHAMANLPVYLHTGHIESVHQFRIGIRRLRSAMSAFSPALNLKKSVGLTTQMKSIFNELGQIRDADVFLDETLDSLSKSIIPPHYSDILRHEITQYRQQRYEEVLKIFESTPFARFIIDTNAWIDSDQWLRLERPIDELMRQRSIGTFAESRLAKMNKKLFKLGTRAENGNLDDWHMLRIMTKKVRYASEPLLDIVGDNEGPRYSKSLSKLQNTLGKINDLNSISRFLNDVEVTLDAKRIRDFKEASAFCVGWGAASANDAVADLLPSWYKFKKTAKDIWSS